MTEQQIMNKVKLLPDSLKKEVLDFVGYLLEKYSSKQQVKTTPKFGSAKGKYSLSEDFDAPLDDFKAYM